jgi:hypothetical protein
MYSFLYNFPLSFTTTTIIRIAMTNLDGVYATNDIEKETIIFTEADMPDCELHRSKADANCEVVELEDGTSAVVSSRPIAAGDFFCVPESSDEEDEEDMEEEEEGDESECAMEIS